MRLDKFLKVSRLIKRRTVAKKVSEASHIMVNEKIAKPSYVLKINDIITLHYYTKIITVKVLSLVDNPKNNDLMYELIKEEKTDVTV